LIKNRKANLSSTSTDLEATLNSIKINLDMVDQAAIEDITEDGIEQGHLMVN
jgi:hypothetical protein